MCAGYNQAMRSSDAKYKIYLHQDVFILNHHFIENILLLFRSHPEAGMIGMVGVTQLAPTGIMWKSGHNEIGALYRPTDEPYSHEIVAGEWPTATVQCVDGFLIATQYDLPWREDLFDGWDYYDASQGFEFRRQGYEVLVPDQSFPWCLHDDGKILNLYRYDHYRKIFLQEYGDEITPAVAGSSETEAEMAAYLEMLGQLEQNAHAFQKETSRIIALADTALAAHDVQAFLRIPDQFSEEPGRSALTKSSSLLRLKQMAEAVRIESKLNLPTFADDLSCFEDFCEKYTRFTFAFRSLEFDTTDVPRILTSIRENRLSAYSAAAILYNLISLIGHREKILLTIAADFLEQGDLITAYRYLAAVQNPSSDTASLRDELKAAL